MVEERSLQEVRSLLDQHREEHLALPESVRARDLGGEKDLVRDYSGRVVFELLQNALDRAEKKIRIQWVDGGGGGTLIVGNDGEPITAYQRPASSEEKLSDLHSLLSLHTSTKSAAQSVGNKGVGFRSVFASSQHVKIQSKVSDGSWWGIRLDHPDKVESRPAGRAPSWTTNETASFYDPDWVEEGVPPNADELVTLIRLEEVPKERTGPIIDSISILQSLPLAFLEHRARFRDGRLKIEFEGVGASKVSCVGCPEAHRPLMAESLAIECPEPVRKVTGLELEKAEVRVLMIPENLENGESQQALFWSYLPTEQPSGFGVHIHGDFYLNNSRRNVNFDKGEPKDLGASPSAWNTHLLGIAADLIVKRLWTNPEVCQRDDFWRLANPAHCQNQHLKDAVTTRLLADPRAVEDLIRLAFDGSGGRKWKVERYREFFRVLESWANEAYRLWRTGNGGRLHKAEKEAGGDKLFMWRDLMRKCVRASGANVIPIVESQGEDSNNLVEVARPVPARGDRDETSRIYYRASGTLALPPALRAQGTFVTGFLPPNSKASDFGLLEFTRPELLAHMRPGETDEQHEELLKVAVALALEKDASSVPLSDRADHANWRYNQVKDSAGRKAGEALANLMVPTMEGTWAKACETVLPGDWPLHPKLDMAKLLRIVGAAVEDQVLGRPLSEKVAALLGIGGIPIEEGESGLSIAGWKELAARPMEQRRSAAAAIVRRYPADIAPLLRPEVVGGTHLRKQLVEDAWLTDGLDGSLLGGQLFEGKATYPLAPLHVWWQEPNRGVRTSLLPRIQGTNRPAPWAEALGIEGMGRLDRDGTERTRKALEALRLLKEHHPMVESSNRIELERTYSALIDLLPDSAEGVSEVPILARYYRSDRLLEKTEWVDSGSVWHDAGSHSHKLTAFGEYWLWVVRRGSMRLAAAMGLVDFSPPEPTVKKSPATDPGLQRVQEDKLQGAIRKVMPDLFAISEMDHSTSNFKSDEALRRQALMKIEYAQDVYLEYDFDGRSGSLGKGEEGDVFLIRDPEGPDSGPSTLIFDSEGPLPLAECAAPLSLLICGNRALIDAFRSALVAWSNELSFEQIGSSVRRFRRERGISDQDVARWKSKLEASRLDEGQVSIWQEVVGRVLGKYGELHDGSVKLDMSVAPDIWSKLYPESVGTSANQIQADLEAAAKAQPDGASWPLPPVSFAAYYREDLRRLRSEKRCQYIALAAESRGREEWREELLESLVEAIDAPLSDEEEKEIHCLGFRPDGLLLRRVGVSPDSLASGATYSEAALAFAKGEIPLRDLPKQVNHVVFHRWSIEPSGVGLAPNSPDDYLTTHRRRMVGGARAEKAVLAKALEMAIDGPTELGDSELDALESIIPLLRKSVAFQHRLSRFRQHRSRETLAKLLHISEYLGDAGFDVLVPSGANSGSAFWRAVEVKRVTSLDGATFFLSENERRRALEIPNIWAIWLVSTDGGSLDMTDEVLALLRKSSHEVNQLLVQGMKPNEWQFGVVRNDPRPG